MHGPAVGWLQEKFQTENSNPDYLFFYWFGENKDRHYFSVHCNPQKFYSIRNI
jgi:hypothetical protein